MDINPEIHFDIAKGEGGYTVTGKESGQLWATVPNIAMLQQVVKALEIKIRLDEIKIFS